MISDIETAPPRARAREADRARPLWDDPGALAALATVGLCLAWWLGGAYVAGGLHTDTIELTLWGRETAMGYPKHPPLPSWFAEAAASLAVSVGASPVVALLGIGVTCVGVTAWFVWRTVRIFASRRAALVGVMVLLASPAGTIYGLQLNHNTVLMVFWAATAFYCLKYLEEGRLWDMFALGLMAGLGFLSKYQMAWLFLALAWGTIANPRYRERLLSPKTALGALVFVALVTPNILWLQQNDWPLNRVLTDHRVVKPDDYAESGIGFLIGMVVLFAVPLLTGSLTQTVRTTGEIYDFEDDRDARLLEGRAFLRAVVIGPIIVMVVSTLLTHQMMKPLWVLAFTPAVAAWLAVKYEHARQGAPVRLHLPLILGGISLAVLIVFVQAMVISENRRVGQFSVDTGWLARRADALWARNDGRRLRYLIVDSYGAAPAAGLWLPDATVVTIGDHQPQPQKWAADIVATGGVAVLREPDALRRPVAGLCAARAELVRPRTRVLGEPGPQPYVLAYLPPRAAPAVTCPPMAETGASWRGRGRVALEPPRP